MPELLLEVAHREGPFFGMTIRRLCTDICFDSFAIPFPCQPPPSFPQPPWNALKLVSDFVTTAGAPSPTPPPLLTRPHSFPFPLTVSRSPGQLQQTLSRAHARDQDLNRQDLLSSPLKPVGSPVWSSRTQKIAATEARQAVASFSLASRLGRQ